MVWRFTQRLTSARHRISGKLGNPRISVLRNALNRSHMAERAARLPPLLLVENGTDINERTGLACSVRRFRSRPAIWARHRLLSRAGRERSRAIGIAAAPSRTHSLALAVH